MHNAKIVAPKYSTTDRHSDQKKHPVVDRNLRKSFHFLNISTYEESVHIAYQKYDDLLLELMNKHDIFKKVTVKKTSDAEHSFFQDDKIMVIKELFGQVIREDVSQFLLQSLQKYVSDIGYDGALINADFVKNIATEFFHKVPEMHENILPKDLKPNVLITLSDFQ